MLWEPPAFSNGHETALGKYRMALQTYLRPLQGTRYKASAQQICGCVRVLSFLLQEKKKEAFKDKNAQAAYDQTPWKAPHTEGWDSSGVRGITPIYKGLSEASFHHQKGSCTGKGNVWRSESQWPHRQHRPSLYTSHRKRQGNQVRRVRRKG